MSLSTGTGIQCVSQQYKSVEHIASHESFPCDHTSPRYPASYSKSTSSTLSNTVSMCYHIATFHTTCKQVIHRYAPCTIGRTCTSVRNIHNVAHYSCPKCTKLLFHHGTMQEFEKYEWKLGKFTIDIDGGMEDYENEELDDRQPKGKKRVDDGGAWACLLDGTVVRCGSPQD